MWGEWRSVSGCRGSVREVWKSVWGESEGCGGKCVGFWGGVKCVEKCGEARTHFYTPPLTHLDTSSHTPHTHLPPPHTLSHFPTPLTPSLTSPNTSSQPPRLLQHFPILYQLPHTKISHFSIYCQISLIIK